MRVKKRDNRWNVLGLLLGISIAFIGSWQLDIVASYAVDHVPADWVFWIPIGLKGWQWAGTGLSWRDAYVDFFLLTWVGFVIALGSVLFAFRRMRFYLSKVKQNG